MLTSTRHLLSAVLAVSGLCATSGALAQGTWDLDNCVMTGACTAGGSTVTVSGWYSNGANSAFQAGTLNTGGNAPGGWTGVRSRNSSNASETTSNNNHSIDSLTYGTNGSDGGASFAELVHLNFSKAVDLSSIAATWVHSNTAGSGNFQLWRWNNSSASPGAISGYNAGTMTGWTSVTLSGSDFATGLSKTVTDGTFFSSHWLVSTAFNSHNNDAFKLGTVHASGVCAGTNQSGAGTSGGACAPSSNNQTPEPATLAMVLMAVAGATVARRRKQAV